MRYRLKGQVADFQLSLHETFSPEEARCILRKLEFHFMPKHGSWPNMAEIQLSVLARTISAQLAAMHLMILNHPGLTMSQRFDGSDRVANG